MRSSSWRRTAGHAHRVYGTTLVSRSLPLSKVCFVKEIRRVARNEGRVHATANGLSSGWTGAEEKRDTDEGIRRLAGSHLFRRPYHNQRRPDTATSPAGTRSQTASSAPSLSTSSEDHDAACLSIFERIYRAKSHPSPSVSPSLTDASASPLLSPSRGGGDASSALQEGEVDEDAGALSDPDCESTDLPSLQNLAEVPRSLRPPDSSVASGPASSPSAASPLRPLHRRSSKLSCHVLVCMLADLARSGVRTREAWQPLLLLLLQALPRLSAQQIQQTALALSRAGLCAPVVLQGLSEALYWKCEQKKALPDHLVLFLDALRRLRYCPSTRHLNKYIERMKEGKKKLTVSHCLKLLRFFAEAGVEAGDLKYPAFYWGLYERLTTGLSSLHPPELAATAQLLAQLGVRDSLLFDRLCLVMYNRSADLINTNVVVASRVDEALEASSRTSRAVPASPVAEAVRAVYRQGVAASTSPQAALSATASSLALQAPSEFQWAQTTAGPAARNSPERDADGKPCLETDHFFAALVHLGRTLLHIKAESPPVHFWLALKQHIEHHALSLRPEHVVFTLAVPLGPFVIVWFQLASMLSSFSSLSYRHRTLHATLAFRLLQGSASPDLGCLDELFLRSVSPLVRLPRRQRRATRLGLPETSLPLPLPIGLDWGVNGCAPERASSSRSASPARSLSASQSQAFVAPFPSPPCPKDDTTRSGLPLSACAGELASACRAHGDPAMSDRAGTPQVHAEESALTIEFVQATERQGRTLFARGEPKAEGQSGNGTSETGQHSTSNARGFADREFPSSPFVSFGSVWTNTFDVRAEGTERKTSNGQAQRLAADAHMPPPMFFSVGEGVTDRKARQLGGSPATVHLLPAHGMRAASDLSRDSGPPSTGAEAGRATEAADAGEAPEAERWASAEASGRPARLDSEGCACWPATGKNTDTEAGAFSKVAWGKGPVDRTGLQRKAASSGRTADAPAGEGGGPRVSGLARVEGDGPSKSPVMIRPASFVARRIEPAVAAAMLDACVELKYRDRLFLASLAASLKVAVEESGIHKLGPFPRANGLPGDVHTVSVPSESLRVAESLEAAESDRTALAPWSESTFRRVYEGQTGPEGRRRRSLVGLHEVAGEVVWTPGTPGESRRLWRKPMSQPQTTPDAGSRLSSVGSTEEGNLQVAVEAAARADDQPASTLRIAGHLGAERNESKGAGPSSRTPSGRLNRGASVAALPDFAASLAFSHTRGTPDPSSSGLSRPLGKDALRFLSEFDASQVDALRAVAGDAETGDAGNVAEGEGLRWGEDARDREAVADTHGVSSSASVALPSHASTSAQARSSPSRSAGSSTLFASSISGVMRFRYTPHFFELLRRAALQAARQSPGDAFFLSNADLRRPRETDVSRSRAGASEAGERAKRVGDSVDGSDQPEAARRPPRDPSERKGENLGGAPWQEQGGALLGGQLRKSTKSIVGRCKSFVPADARIERKIPPEELRRRFWDRLFATAGHPARRRLYHRRLFLAACELRFRALPSRPLRLSPGGVRGQERQAEGPAGGGAVSRNGALAETARAGATKPGSASARCQGEVAAENAEGRSEVEGACEPFRDCGVLGRRRRQRLRAAGFQRPMERRKTPTASESPEENAFRDAQTVRSAMRRWSLLRRAFLEPYEDHARALQLALCERRLSAKTHKPSAAATLGSGGTQSTAPALPVSDRTPNAPSTWSSPADEDRPTPSCSSPGLALLFLPRPRDTPVSSRLPVLVDTALLLPVKRLFEGPGCRTKATRGAFLANARLGHMQARILRDYTRSRERLRNRCGAEQGAGVGRLNGSQPERLQGVDERAAFLRAHAATKNEHALPSASAVPGPERNALAAKAKVAAGSDADESNRQAGARVWSGDAAPSTRGAAETASVAIASLGPVQPRTEEAGRPACASLADAAEKGVGGSPGLPGCAARRGEDGGETDGGATSQKRQEGMPQALGSIRPLCPLLREVACALEASVRLQFLPPGLLTAFASHLLHIVTNVSAVLCSPPMAGTACSPLPAAAPQGGEEARRAGEFDEARREASLRRPTKRLHLELGTLLRCINRAADAACCVPGVAAGEAEDGDERDDEQAEARRATDMRPFPQEQQEAWKILEKCYRAAAFQVLWNPGANLRASGLFARAQSAVPFSLAGCERSGSASAGAASESELLLDSLRVYTRLARQLALSSRASFFSPDDARDQGQRSRSKEGRCATDDAPPDSSGLGRPGGHASSREHVSSEGSQHNACEDDEARRGCRLFLSHREWGQTLLAFIATRLSRHGTARQRERSGIAGKSRVGGVVPKGTANQGEDAGSAPESTRRDGGDPAASGERDERTKQAPYSNSEALAGEPNTNRAHRQVSAKAGTDPVRQSTRATTPSLGVRDLTQILAYLSRIRPFLTVDGQQVGGEEDRLWMDLHAETKRRLLSALRNGETKHPHRQRSSHETAEVSAARPSAGDFHRRDVMGALVALSVDALPPRFMTVEEFSRFHDQPATSLSQNGGVFPGTSKPADGVGSPGEDRKRTTRESVLARETPGGTETTDTGDVLRAAGSRTPHELGTGEEGPERRRIRSWNDEQLFGQTVRKLARESAVPTRLLLRAIHRELLRQGRLDAAAYAQSQVALKS
ncbi:conserved hypothetical protein [Neospora caninum Liverpool]|uniref:Uncharacterized protein n=1 Tax=Neospora caninum (strain Liverpool) TaxID=572307 RepID=F0VCX9_NEOCL|nr:conserved hypothetical protein [Neospora caninum Liverpool]CBZ51494.1 conserved hypothetical protein [Neospora caninum Liverpool]|eukprot:XP_003881527.1 conserved hypothetical protein [Neospora caninum Liverpool]